MTGATPTPGASDAGVFTLWAVLRRSAAVGAEARSGTPLTDAIESVERGGVTLRGLYDVSGLRADADLLIWLTGPTADGLQRALRVVRRSTELAGCSPTWNALGVHREAEFSRTHAPAFLRGLAPKGWLTPVKCQPVPQAMSCWRWAMSRPFICHSPTAPHWCVHTR